MKHEITKTWVPGQETDEYVLKIWFAECTCGWKCGPVPYQQILMAAGAHEAGAENVAPVAAQAAVHGLGFLGAGT
jgi:hypothetical protein